MVITLLLSSANIVFAADRQENLKKALFKKGYFLKNIEVFPETEKKELASALNKDPNTVDIKTSVLETDNLAEIESFMSATDEELISMGANPSKIETTRRELEDLYTKNTEQLAKEKNISATEAKFFKKAIEKGLNAKHQNKNRKVKGRFSKSERSYFFIFLDFAKLNIYYNCYNIYCIGFSMINAISVITSECVNRRL